MEDENLVELVLDGDDGALETLHARYFQQLFQYIYMQTSDYHDSEEIIQDVFFKMARNLGEFEGKSSFKTWLFSISRNTVIDYYRKRDKHRKTMAMEQQELESFTDTVRSSEEQVIQNGMMDQIVQELNRLSPDYRTVLHLRLMEGFSTKETANIMGKTTFSVKSLQKRARKKLQSVLEMRWTDSEANI
ncbi:RNA polymerase subunit sigma-24 [Salipaludibacillus neizhouensis]|uniref:RNA polymerase subunit sigma-24 n=1 Tax=Salipaludibacillus neizhouensis TaxID=885475 RepID=A0A3A9KCP9_9BACI|nr:RNA polymerase sigma factor [Salipaludibacillus neizhouensis]RKL68312.1 RNA polymerase subunit sigma-24 [Salipaludibacillus neizhouensis]